MRRSRHLWLRLNRWLSDKLGDRPLSWAGLRSLLGNGKARGRKLNLRLLAILAACTVLLGGGVHLLHAIQVKRNAGALLEQANLAEKEQDLDRAANYLRVYLGLRPDDTNALARLGLLLKDQPRHRLEAIEALDQVLRRDGSRHEVRRAAAECAMWLDRYLDAIAHLNFLLRESTPEDAWLEHLLGQCYERIGSYPEAASAFADAIRHQPDKIETYEWLGKLLRQRREEAVRADAVRRRLAAEEAALLSGAPGDAFPVTIPWAALCLAATDPADRVMDAMIAANPRSAPAHLVRWRYRKLYGLPRASDDVARARELAGDDADVLIASAEDALDQSDPPAARAFVDRALALHRRDQRLYVLLGRLGKQPGQRDQALAAIERGLRDLPDDPDLLLSQAELLIDGGQTEKAREVIDRLRRQEKQLAALDYLEARIHMGLEQWVEAAGRLERTRHALGASAEHVFRTNLALAWCYDQLASPDLELEACRRAVAANPLRLLGRLALAGALEKAGLWDDAVREYRLGAVNAPEARLRLAWLLIARNAGARLADRNWEEVRRLLDETARVLPDSPEVTLLRAETLAAEDQPTAALLLLRSACERQPKAIRLHEALLGLLLRREEWDQALAVVERFGKEVGDTPGARHLAAVYWARRGGEAAPANLARLAEKLDPFDVKDQGRLLATLAAAAAAVGDRPAAERFMAQMVKVRPNDLRAWVQFFDFSLQTGREEGMRQAAQALERLEGAEGTWWRYCQGVLLLWKAHRQGDAAGLAEARQHLAVVTERRPAWSRVRLLEADLALVEKDAEQAIRRYQQALELAEKNTALVQRLADMLWHNGRYAEAEAALAKLPPEMPLPTRLGQIAAELALRKGDHRRAQDLAERVAAGSKDFRDLLWLGQLYQSAGRADRAEAVLRRAVALAEREPDAWLTLIVFLARSDRRSQAEALIAQLPGKLPPDRLPLALAPACEIVGKPAEADAHYRAALAARPNDTALQLAAGIFYLRKGRPAEAEPLFRKLLAPETRTDPEVAAAARHQLALLLTARNNHVDNQKAAALLRESLRIKGDNVADLRMLAFVLHLHPAGRAEAVSILEDLIRRRLAGPEDRLRLAQLYELGRDWEKAAQTLQALIALPQGEQPAYLASYIRNLLRRGQTGEAQAWLARLARLDPRSWLTLKVTAEVLKKQEKNDEAIALVLLYLKKNKEVAIDRAAVLLEYLGETREAEALFRQYAADEARHPERLLTLAGFLTRQGRTTAALEVCARAWQRCPPEQAAAAGVAVLLAGSADPATVQQVESWLKAATAKQPGNPELMLHLASLRHLQGRYDEAEALCRKSLALDPRNVTALNNLAWLLALHRGEPAAARDMIEKAIELAGPIPELLGTRGIIHLARGESGQAVADLEVAAAEAPTASRYLHLARAYAAAKGKAEAIAAFQKAKIAGLDVSRLDPLERPAYQELLSKLDLK